MAVRACRLLEQSAGPLRFYFIINQSHRENSKKQPSAVYNSHPPLLEAIHVRLIFAMKEIKVLRMMMIRTKSDRHDARPKDFHRQHSNVTNRPFRVRLLVGALHGRRVKIDLPPKVISCQHTF